MTVSELIDLLREQERTGRGDVVVKSDGFDITSIGYVSENDSVEIVVYDYTQLPDLEPANDEEFGDEEQGYLEPWDED